MYPYTFGPPRCQVPNPFNHERVTSLGGSRKPCLVLIYYTGEPGRRARDAGVYLTSRQSD